MGWSLAAAAVVAFVASNRGGKGSSPQSPEAPPAPQAAQEPDSQTLRSQQSGTAQAGGSPGVSQTFLTGSNGIDPSLLNLGKNTLLGGGTGG